MKPTTTTLNQAARQLEQLQTQRQTPVKFSVIRQGDRVFLRWGRLIVKILPADLWDAI